jgi:hypothetical protein
MKAALMNGARSYADQLDDEAAEIEREAALAARVGSAPMMRRRPMTPSDGLRPPYMTGVEMRRVAASRSAACAKIPEEISVTDFSARHRILPETSTSEGPYDPSVVPYVGGRWI